MSRASQPSMPKRESTRSKCARESEGEKEMDQKREQIEPSRCRWPCTPWLGTVGIAASSSQPFRVLGAAGAVTVNYGSLKLVERDIAKRHLGRH